MQIKKTLKVTATLHCKTGLRIGGTKDSIDIGATNPIVRHPLTKEPYIPGSSIKGRMRSLLESVYARPNNDKACDCGTCEVCQTFGSLQSTSPTRILVRDAFMTTETKEELIEANEEYGINFVETKTENMILRKTGRADKPRHMERIPAGTEFHVEFVVRIFEGDDAAKIQKLIYQGMDMIENDYLGGSGGRGYGQVEFRNRAVESITWEKQI